MRMKLRGCLLAASPVWVLSVQVQQFHTIRSAEDTNPVDDRHTTNVTSGSDSHDEKVEEELPFPPPLRVAGGGVPEGLGRKLWEGMDLNKKEEAQILEWTMEERRLRNVVGSTKVVEVLGPPDAGTNLIQQLLDLNWPEHASSYERPILFKHSISSAEDLCERYVSIPVVENFTVVLAVRSPISQLVSWHKAPYFLRHCAGRSFDEMGAQCFANASPEWNDVIIGPEDEAYLKYYAGRSLEFKNTMSVYNTYLQQYKEMLSAPACSKLHVELVHYEDVVFSPEEVLAKLARRAGWPMPSTVRVLDSPSKDHGEAVGKLAAMEKIDSRAYLQVLSSTDRLARCGELNLDLIRHDVEKSFTTSPTSYLEDCH